MNKGVFWIISVYNVVDNSLRRSPRPFVSSSNPSLGLRGGLRAHRLCIMIYHNRRSASRTELEHRRKRSTAPPTDIWMSEHLGVIRTQAREDILQEIINAIHSPSYSDLNNLPIRQHFHHRTPMAGFRLSCIVSNPPSDSMRREGYARAEASGPVVVALMASAPTHHRSCDTHRCWQRRGAELPPGRYCVDILPRSLDSTNTCHNGISVHCTSSVPPIQPMPPRMSSMIPIPNAMIPNPTSILE